MPQNSHITHVPCEHAHKQWAGSTHFLIDNTTIHTAGVPPPDRRILPTKTQIEHIHQWFCPHCHNGHWELINECEGRARKYNGTGDTSCTCPLKEIHVINNCFTFTWSIEWGERDSRKSEVKGGGGGEHTLLDVISWWGHCLLLLNDNIFTVTVRLCLWVCECFCVLQPYKNDTEYGSGESNIGDCVWKQCEKYIPLEKQPFIWV